MLVLDSKWHARSTANVAQEVNAALGGRGKVGTLLGSATIRRRDVLGQAWVVVWGPAQLELPEGGLTNDGVRFLPGRHLMAALEQAAAVEPALIDRESGGQLVAELTRLTDQVTRGLDRCAAQIPGPRAPGDEVARSNARRP